MRFFNFVVLFFFFLISLARLQVSQIADDSYKAMNVLIDWYNDKVTVEDVDIPCPTCHRIIVDAFRISGAFVQTVEEVRVEEVHLLENFRSLDFSLVLNVT